MHLWIINHYATPPDTPGLTRHFDFATEFIRQGHQVSIFTSGFNHRTRKEERLEGKQVYRRENISGIEFIWVRTPPYHRGNDWRRVLNMLGYSICLIPLGISIRKQPDVILASSPHPFSGLVGYILAKTRGARFVFEVRDLWPQTLVDIGGHSDKSIVVKLLRVMERFLYKKAEKTVVLHPRASDYIERQGIPASKIVYIPNGVSPDLFSGTGAKIPQELNEIISSLRSEGKWLVVYLGAHGIANALDTIVESARLLQDEGADKVHFLFVGDGPEKAGLVERTQNLGLDNINFYQSIPKDAVPNLLRAIDATVISWKKSDLYQKYGMSSNKLWDYMMSAKPVVWAINSANDPVNKADCGITVSPENTEEMAKAIIELCSLSEDERQHMGLKGHDYVMKYHSVPVLASQLLKTLGYQPFLE
jgi:glycosyltransferase involved in cell wall biosynthesis